MVGGYQLLQPESEYMHGAVYVVSRVCITRMVEGEGVEKQ